MLLPGQCRWSTGFCTEVAGPQSYEVKVGGTTYRRNRRHLIQAGTPPNSDTNLVGSEPTGV